MARDQQARFARQRARSAENGTYTKGRARYERAATERFETWPAYTSLSRAQRAHCEYMARSDPKPRGNPNPYAHWKLDK